MPHQGQEKKKRKVGKSNTPNNRLRQVKGFKEGNRSLRGDLFQELGGDLVSGDTPTDWTEIKGEIYFK